LTIENRCWSRGWVSSKVYLVFLVLWQKLEVELRRNGWIATSGGKQR